MDGKIVSRETRREIWPVLRRLGFDTFTDRSAWRRTESGTWLVNFQSFTSYFSMVDGCTTFSFSLNLGVFFDELAGEVSTRPTKPKDYECHFRSKLRKRITQANYARNDIWYVEPDGSNLLDVLSDARSVLMSEGMEWFYRISDLDSALDILLNEDEHDALFGIGGRESPARKLLIERATRLLEK